jgi:SPP1 gp7 family putative phage head morphogenesis protein
VAENIYDVAQSFRKALLKREREAATRLVKAYGSAYERLSAQLKILTDQIEKARAAGEMVSEAWLLRQERYRALLGQVIKEIGKFADLAGSVITAEQRRAVNQALQDSERLLLSAIEQAPEGISTEFNRVNKGAVENLVGFLGDGSPLKSLLDELPRDAAAKVSRGLTDGIIRGRNPKAIAREIRAGLNGNLTRALRIARTETLRAYREASHQTYQENSDVLEGWIWLSALGSRSCIACIALHGTFHLLDERMKSHISCRCTQVPAVKGQDLGIQKGTDWFKKQLAKVQREIFDQEDKYKAYKAGKVKLEDFVSLRRSPEWGDSYQVLSLDRALNKEGRFPKEPRRETVFPSPPVPSRSGPAGMPVSKALKIPGGKFGDRLKAAVKAINQVHGDGDLPEIPVNVTSARNRHGAYWSGRRGGLWQAGKITINRSGGHPEFTLAHEVGHFLDQQAIGERKGFASIADRRFEQFRQVAARSRAIQELENQYKTPSLTTRSGVKFPTPRKHLLYLLSREEVWARAYAQYIALRSSNPAMKAGLKAILESDHPSTAASQWTNDDFAPVAEAIEALLKELGWRT